MSNGQTPLRYLGSAMGGLLVIGLFGLGFYLLRPMPGGTTPLPEQPETSGTVPTTAKAAPAFVADGTLETDEVDIASKLPGRLALVAVDEGDLVRAGQVVAVLEAEELDAKRDQGMAGVRAAEVQVQQGELAVELERRKAEDQVNQARAGVEAAQAALNMAREKLAALEKGARPQEIAQAEQAVAAAQAAFDTATKTYTRVKGLAEEGVVAQQKADEAEMVYRSAQAQLTAAQAKLDLVKEGPRQEEVAAARAQVRQAEAGVEAARQAQHLAEDARLMVDVRRKDIEAAQQKVAASQGTVREVAAYQKQTRITSPISGRVSQRMSRTGEIIAPGYAILTVARGEGYWVTVYVDESKFAGRRVGDHVTVEIPALGRSLPGTIARVAPAADFATRRATNEKGSYDVRTVQLRVTLDRSPRELATGMTARVHFAATGGR